MNKFITGVLLGLSLYVVAQAATPTQIPEPPKKENLSYEENILYRLDFYSRLAVIVKTPYVWGGSKDLKALDCSGYIYWICHKAGLPYKRTTSLRMWLDHGSWPGERVLVKFDARDRAQFPDLLFWTFSVKRPAGHTALVILNAEDKKGNRTILFREASSSKKIVKETEMKTGDYRWVRLEGILILDLAPGFKKKK